GAADDLARLSLPHVDAAELKSVRVRMLRCLEHAPDPVEREVAVEVEDTAMLDPLHLRARDAEAGRALRRRHVDGHVLTEPAQWHLHQRSLQRERRAERARKASE